MGLNTFDGSGPTQYTYYGANLLKQYVHLAPNAIVFLNHLCYSAGNGEPGMTIPTYDLAASASTTWPLAGWRPAREPSSPTARSSSSSRSSSSFDTTVDDSMEDIFRLPPPPKNLGEYWGWVGWDARKYDSTRTPGATLFLDPSQKEGFYRAVSQAT